MCHAPETLRDEIIIAAIKKLVENKEIKVILIDSAGNVISDISLSALRDALRGTDNRTLTDLYKKAYDSTNDREKVSIENDAVGLAKESTLSSRLPREIELDDGTGTYDKIFRTGNALNVQIKGEDAGLAKETTLSNILSQLDVALSTLAKLQRWGRNVEPTWIHGDEITAPAENTKLVSVTVSSGKKGYIYGFFIVAGEANDFKINWTSGGETKSIRIPFQSGGALQYVDIVPLNEGSPADENTEISITNVNAGSSEVVYQARLFYAEV